MRVNVSTSYGKFVRSTVKCIRFALQIRVKIFTRLSLDFSRVKSPPPSSPPLPRQIWRAFRGSRVGRTEPPSKIYLYEFRRELRVVENRFSVSEKRVQWTHLRRDKSPARARCRAGGRVRAVSRRFPAYLSRCISFTVDRAHSPALGSRCEAPSLMQRFSSHALAHTRHVCIMAPASLPRR